MNKLLIIMIVLAVLITPSIANAQDIPEDMEEAIEKPWILTTNRTVIWIGESLDVHINGTANTSFNLELRMFNSTDNSLYNASYSSYGRTDDNGTVSIFIPDDFTEIPGEYRIQIIINNLAVVYRDVQVNYDPDRWHELERGDIWDFFGFDKDNLPDYTIHDYIDDSVALDKYEIGELKKLEYLCYVIIIGIVGICLAQANTWINQYVKWSKKHGKGSVVARTLSRSQDRTGDYGGSIIGGEEPKIGKNAPGLTSSDNEWNLRGKKTSQVMAQVNINAKKIGCKMPPKAKHEVKTGLFSRKGKPDGGAKEHKKIVNQKKKDLKVIDKQDKVNKKREKELAKLNKKLKAKEPKKEGETNE